MPKIVELIRHLFSHTRNINAEIYTNHIKYTIPTYEDNASASLISLIHNGHGSLVLTVRRNASVPEENKLPGKYRNEANRPDIKPHDEVGSKWRGDFGSDWRLPY
jgi:hypothetical protein